MLSFQKGKMKIKTVLLFFVFLLFYTPLSHSIENQDCLDCHGDASNFDMESPDEARLLVNSVDFNESIHKDFSCTDCHDSINDLPHDEKLPLVDCKSCHDDVMEVYSKSLHGLASANNDPLAPHCWDCHSKHNIRPQKDPKSKTNPINIPVMCGACHAENAPVALARNIEQHNILQHYEESIHGEGLIKKGLTVTAVCTSCHTGHNVLPHNDPNSTINRNNVVKTCTQCHALIEQVHRKIIDGKLWEEEPQKVPICIDCHQPHEIRKVYYDEGVSDRDCMLCHSNNLETADKRSLKAVNTDDLAHSTHKDARCAQCHTGTNAALERPCEPITAKVDCSICHAEAVEDHKQGTHGKLLAKGDSEAPDCLDCHGGHKNLSKKDPESPIFPKNIPTLCGKCHRDGEKVASRKTSTQEHIIGSYTMSIHGKGLIESGLVVTAMCSDCHTPHKVLPKKDPESSVNPENVPKTCGKCHYGIQEAFSKSIHSPLVAKTDKELPVCSDCHTAHAISRTDQPDFKQDIMRTCGRCHEKLSESYFDTYHGKVSKLGSAGAAKCYDCHGSHDILPPNDTNSHLSRKNIVATCEKCHKGSNKRFAGYLTHATHHDPRKYPALFITFWGMTALLVGTFVFFGLHTLAWLPLSFKEMKLHKEKKKEGQLLFKRFDPIIRQMHFVLIISFFGLALTGMTLKFSYMPWAVWLSHALGGFKAAGVIHRVCAIIMFTVFIIHLGVVIQRKKNSGKTWWNLLAGTSSLVPNLTDAKDFLQTMKWFLRMGPRPTYGKWTYWEKFDYFAVFWGVAIIGSTGLMLWFPEFFTRFFPGWFINVATIIHSDEALLAVGFIFTIHFFNTHFRPDKFPMDMAMFTGKVSVEELKKDKPRYYEELKASGELDKNLEQESPKEFRFWAAIFGTAALIIGFTLVLFILWSMTFGYK